MRQHPYRTAGKSGHMATIGQDWTFEHLTRNIIDVLAEFDGEHSVKGLFWSLLSYDRERTPLLLREYPPYVSSNLSHLEVFASSEDMLVFYANSPAHVPRGALECLCRSLQKKFPRCFLLLHESRDDLWRVVFPDDSKKHYLRVLDIPGAEGERNETGRALAALSAADPDDGSSVGWLEITHRMEAFFPGPVPRLWDDESIGAYIGQIRPGLKRVEEFMHDIKSFPLLTRRQEQGDDLTGDEQAPDGSRMNYGQWRLVVHNLRLVVHMAYEMPRRGMELEDLVQEGCIGLMGAARRFEPTLGYRFSTYAYRPILWTMQRALAENASLIRWPDHIVGEIARANASKDEKALPLGCREVLSFNSEGRTIRDPWRPSDDPLDLLLAAEKRERVLAEVNALNWRERQVVMARYGLNGAEERILEDVGEQLGVTRERVRQIEARALQRLEQRMTRSGYEFVADTDRSDSLAGEAADE